MKLLAFESTQSRSALKEGSEHGWSVHYIHEAGSFVPLVQVRQARAMALSETTDAKALMEANGGVYDIEQDPLWNGEQRNVPRAFDRKEMAFYQCDHLGTPQELTDHEGSVAWSAQYKAWGEAREAISEAGRRAGFTNPIRFQGQYFDEETGLHYNRYRYFDPHGGRFASSDPIGIKGGLNTYAYGANPIEWIDPFGLTPDGPILKNPQALISRQGRSAMTGSKVKRYTSAMKAQGGYGTFPPIEAANVGDGKLVIIDGHHRAEAARKAGVKEVPVNVNAASPEAAEKLKDEAAMALAERINRC